MDFTARGNKRASDKLRASFLKNFQKPVGDVKLTVVNFGRNEG
jgi:hypothetical protein